MAVEAQARQYEVEGTQEPEDQTGFGKKWISVGGEDIEIPLTGYFHKLTDALVYQMGKWQPDRPQEKDYYQELSGHSGRAIKAAFERLADEQDDLIQALRHDAMMRNREYDARLRLADPRTSFADRESALRVTSISPEDQDRRDYALALAHLYLSDEVKKIIPDFDPRELCQQQT